MMGAGVNDGGGGDAWGGGEMRWGERRGGKQVEELHPDPNFTRRDERSWGGGGGQRKERGWSGVGVG
jgi:hypothetical protein